MQPKIFPGLFLFALVLLAGCTAASEKVATKTNEQPCGADEDCGGSQTCVRTAAEQAANIELGLCTEQTCVPNEQLGCGTCTGCGAPHAGYPTDIGCDGDTFQCKFVCSVDDDATPDEDESIPCPGGAECVGGIGEDADPNAGLCVLP